MNQIRSRPPLTTTTSGCKALEGCDRKESCLRHHIYRGQDGYTGWSAHQMCRLSEFVKNDYLHFIEITGGTDEAAHRN